MSLLRIRCSRSAGLVCTRGQRSTGLSSPSKLRQQFVDETAAPLDIERVQEFTWAMYRLPFSSSFLFILSLIVLLVPILFSPKVVYDFSRGRLTMSIQDDKAQHVVPFILGQLEAHQTTRPNVPFFIGLNGVQGAGKSVLVEILQSTLQAPPHSLSTVVFSLDDLYLTHEDQVALAKAHAQNPLLQHRGQPSTHDIPLALETFKGLKEGRQTKIPVYNKAAFNGEGDREDETTWETANKDSSSPVRVVLFEGWCVGFRPLSDEALARKQKSAAKALEDDPSSYKGRLGHNTLESVSAINEALKRYDEITDQFDAFIHIDAADPQYVYKWRLEQEGGLRAKKGSGMTDEQVKHFVDGYYPAYELYTETLREGVFKHSDQDASSNPPKRQMRLVVGVDRKIIEVIRI